MKPRPHDRGRPLPQAATLRRHRAGATLAAAAFITLLAVLAFT
jgi:hypothetical protein